MVHQVVARRLAYLRSAQLPFMLLPGQQCPRMRPSPQACCPGCSMQPHDRQSSGKSKACVLCAPAIRKTVRCHSFPTQPLHFLLQDTAAVLEDVRKIIAEQLGTDQDKVCNSMRTSRPVYQPLLTGPTSLQVQASSKFVDLGADSLDTVSHMPASCSPLPSHLHHTLNQII